MRGSMRASVCGGFGPPRLRAISVLPAAERRRIEPSGELQPSAKGRLRAAALNAPPSGRSLRSARMFAKTAGLRARRLRPPMAYTIE